MTKYRDFQDVYDLTSKLGPYDLNQIYTGDARELAEAIPDNSVDLIFADPVYDRIDDYEWLARTAARVLKDDRACLVWTSTALMSGVVHIMSKYLTWAWCLYWQRIANISIYPGRTGITIVTPCLWYEKGRSRTYRKMADLKSSPRAASNNGHQWAKPLEVIQKWLEAFTQPNATVFDPFTGGGTVPAVCKMLGRNYLAFEIDPETAELARERVLMTQPPLIVPEPQQLELV